MVTRKKVGQVTVEEKKEIQQLFERRNGLNELARVVTVDNTDLYEKLVKDLGETGTRFQQWWTAWLRNTIGRVVIMAVGK